MGVKWFHVWVSLGGVGHVELSEGFFELIGPKISLTTDVITAASKVKQTLETSYTPREISCNQAIARNKTPQLYYKLNGCEYHGRFEPSSSLF